MDTAMNDKAKQQPSQRLVEGPRIAGHRIRYNDAKRVLIIDNEVVSCTPCEYRLLQQLLQAPSYVPLTNLVQQAFHSSLTRSSRRRLSKYISRVREKLWVCGLEIFCVTTQGYLLAAESSSASREQSEGDEARERFQNRP
jgi:DNA-binding response OmpR family regulator